MKVFSYWKTVYSYFFKEQGVPREVLDHYCISLAEAGQISDIIETTRPHTILEVGTFSGLSAGVIALASAKMPESRLICVDPNLPVGEYVDFYTPQTKSTETRGTLDLVRPMLAHFGQGQRTTIMEGFFSHLSTWASGQIIMCGGNPEKASVIGGQISEGAPYDLAFIDAEHEADAVYRDLSLLAPYMAPNGIIVLHDVSGDCWGAKVCAGAAQFTQNHAEYSIKTDHNLGFLSRDNKKVWLTPQRDHLIGRARRKIAALAVVLALRLSSRAV